MIALAEAIAAQEAGDAADGGAQGPGTSKAGGAAAGDDGGPSEGRGLSVQVPSSPRRSVQIGGNVPWQGSPAAADWSVENVVRRPPPCSAQSILQTPARAVQMALLAARLRCIWGPLSTTQRQETPSI